MSHHLAKIVFFCPIVLISDQNYLVTILLCIKSVGVCDCNDALCGKVIDKPLSENFLSDNLVLMARSMEELQRTLDKWKDAIAKKRTKVNMEESAVKVNK